MISWVVEIYLYTYCYTTFLDNSLKIVLDRKENSVTLPSMSQTWSPELTFIPFEHPHEIVDRSRGEALIKRVNRWLAKTIYRKGVFMVAKLDPHHNVYLPNETWAVELTPFSSFEVSWLSRTNPDHRLFMRAIDRLFKGLREKFDLVPSHKWREKGVEHHCAQGGAHVHLGADHFWCGADWYAKMEAFHRNLAIDYANRPYARWLLSHWMAGGHHNVVDREDLTCLEPMTENEIFGRMLNNTHAIESRFMRSAKSSYLTWEFRILGMVENARQLRAGVLLIEAWMDSLSAGPKREFSLTTEKWDSYTTLRGAKKACKTWVEELGLDWQDYERDFFDRNYRLRIENQKWD